MKLSFKFLFAVGCGIVFLSTVSTGIFPILNRSSQLQAHGTKVQDEQKQQKQEGDSKHKDDEKIIIPGDDPDAVARRDFMRTKLMYTQNIFEGLTIGNFEAIDAAIKEVRLVTEGGQWVAIDNDVYRRLTEEFQLSIRRLEKAAETQNIEATALRFYEMSTRCIDCHQHIRVARYHF